MFSQACKDAQSFASVLERRRENDAATIKQTKYANWMDRIKKPMKYPTLYSL